MNTRSVALAASPALARLMLAALCAALAVPAYAGSKVSVKGSRPEGAPRDPSYGHVLIVGVTPSVNQRCAWEFFMKSALEARGVKATTSCSSVESREPMTVESIEQAVTKVQADSVLATRLAARTNTVTEGGSRDTRGSAGYKATDMGWATDYYGWYGVPVVYADFTSYEPLVFTQSDVWVDARLYAVQGHAVVYDMRILAKKMESRDAALHDIAAGVAKELEKAKLVK